MKNSLIIFLLQYNLQHFSLFDFYSPQGGWGCEGGSWYNRFVTNMHRLTGRRRLCFWFQLIKLRPTHWAICFLWPRCCFSHFLAKTKCDSHYYRVLSLLSSSSLFLIPFGRRCKNVLAVVVVAARRHYYYCFYRYFLYCLWLLAFIRARKWICFLRLDYYDCVWLQILHSMKCCCFFFCSLLASLVLAFFYAVHWSCKWFWLRFLDSVFWGTDFALFILAIWLLMFINETT